MARKKRRKRRRAAPEAVAPPPTTATAPPGFSDGLAKHQAGDLAAAAAAYRRVLDDHPDHADSWHLLGVATMQQGDPAAGAGLIETAGATNAEAPAYHDHLGLCLRQAGNPADAEAHHRRALSLDPDFAPAHNNLAGTLLALGRAGDAEAAARRSLELLPRNPDTLTNLGQILLARGRAEGAVNAFEAAHSERPPTPESWAQLANAYLRARRRADAEAAFEKATAMAPDHAAVWFQRGAFDLAIEAFGAAAEAFATAAGLRPEDPTPLTNQGIALWRAGQLAEAEDVFHRVLADWPDHIGALLGLAAIRSALGDEAGARLVPLAKEMAAAAEALDRTTAALADTVDGTVRVSVHESFSPFIIDHLASMRERMPDVEFELFVTHIQVNLSKREADILIRDVLPETSSLTARKLGEATYAVYGAADYVERHPAAATNRRYAECDWIGFDEEHARFAGYAWLRAKMGNRQPVHRTNNGLVLRQAVAAGAGLGVLPCFAGDADPGTVRLTPPLKEVREPLWMLVHPDMKRRPAIRAVMDALIEAFQEKKSLLAGAA
ncbi:MAG: LysR substrate-binding domain-containing protein [Magnetovibrio sp.]|nr:LysR substrate-binding domain-containing protein [Magnetovibrio sp.]